MRVKCQPGDDLVGDDARQILERGVFGRDRGVFGADHVDTRIRTGGIVQQHGTFRQVDQLEARTQRPAFARRHVLAIDAEPADLVVELDVEAVARLGTAHRRQFIAQGIADQPAGLTLDRRDLDTRERLRDRPPGPAGIHRVQPAAGEQQRQRREGRKLPHATRFTSRSGTTITFFGALPSSRRTTLSLASAAASVAARSVPLGSVSVSRSLPLTWIAIVTSSSTSNAGSTAGQGALATRPSWPAAAQASSATCGTIGETRRISARVALVRDADGAAFSIAATSS